MPECEITDGGEGGGRSPAEDCVPPGSKFPDIETAQPRNLDVELLPIRRRRTNSHARHDAQADWRLGRDELERAPPAPMIR